MRSVVIIAIGLAALLAAVFLALFWEEEETVVTPAPVEKAEEAKPAPTPVKEPEKKAENVRPSFDVVRINPEGDAVIAGRATGKASVAVIDGGDTVLGTMPADERGEWVFLPSSPLEPGERELSLRATNPDGSIMTSKDVVILVVPERDGDALAITMSIDGSGAARALQTPGAEALALSIDAVNYDDKGNLSLSGTAPEGGAVFLYLDNDFLGNTSADERGSWSLSPQKTVAPGVYELRADHVDENQKVLNRVSIPFKRAENLSNVPDDRKIVVQPGNSLWRIARRIYGTGFDYAVIYRANEDQISDPNLIYPGQVFELPEGMKKP
ncbi:LysM peptidoglycan-binding domain-containing protein [Terasakiella sp. A23]|uniref:LysM peptidoglycan-binding domain-containing protein n=1 Tax=Terasakiella sp. FCG-A23 TaxID=3080561 RepID=UPI0029544CAC|nr:LysM peptidoglycan-binding domain-containing protein [Terasakiella sp. A23]MDV7339263.1 LysM peptidoglycan-binding domain-containing protein [Terasakiella sp. A23]